MTLIVKYPILRIKICNLSFLEETRKIIHKISENKICSLHHENVACTLLLALLWLLAIILICSYHLLNTNSVTVIVWVQHYSFKGIQGCTAGLYDSRVYILNYFIILSFHKGTSRYAYITLSQMLHTFYTCDHQEVSRI